MTIRIDAVSHGCWPPKISPYGDVTKARWRCPECGKSWVYRPGAFGRMEWHDGWIGTSRRWMRQRKREVRRELADQLGADQ